MFLSGECLHPFVPLMFGLGLLIIGAVRPLLNSLGADHHQVEFLAVTLTLLLDVE
jgi:hypothetical protein